MVEPRTIDNLGVEASVRFARDSSTLDPSLLKESSFVSAQSGADIQTPFFQSELDTVFQVGERNAPDGVWEAPPQGASPPSRLFSYTLIPSLGSQDRIETMREHVEMFSGKEEEAHALRDLLTEIDRLTRDSVTIANKRNQYSKG